MSAKVMYTPEYSEELLGLVVELYREEVRPALGELKLSKMLDLLEVAEWNLEQYMSHLKEGHHIECLRHYIVGLLYIYLVIPSSIQFQIKNKNYEVFLALKQMFEKETNMSNVKQVTTHYISLLNDKSSLAQRLESLQIKSRAKRSSTLPSSTLEADLTHHLKPTPLAQSQTVPHHSYEKPPSISTIESGNDVISVTSTSSSIVDDLWSPPEFQPTDQLQLANDNYDAYTDDLGREAPSYLPPPIPKTPPLELESLEPQLIPYTASQVQFSTPPQRLHHAHSFPDGQHIDVGQPVTEYGATPGEDYRMFETTTTHRKDSYHSVLAEDDEESYIQKVMSAKILFELLQGGTLSFLIFDIRPRKDYESNHVPYENVLNIDPSLVNHSRNFQELEDVVKSAVSREDFAKFKNLQKYDQVLFYSDSKTALQCPVDFLAKFSTLLQERRIKNKMLRGGFDSWVKYLSKNNIHKSKLNFVAKKPFESPKPPSVPPPLLPSTTSVAELPLSPKSSQPVYQVQSYNASSEHRPPIPPPHYSQPVQSRPYPVQQTFYRSSTQQKPQPQYYQPAPQNYIPQYPAYPPSQSNASQPNIHFERPYGPQSQYQDYDRHVPQNRSHGHDLQRERINSQSIPTIQRSENDFVRLSITGLRNLGNTCYINSMIQCLFASSRFRDIFLDNKFEEYMNPSFSKAKLSPSLSILFKKMYLNGGCSIVPSGFLRTCIQLRPDLRIPTEQQDTQEFLMFMLDHLHDELSNSNVVVNDYPELMHHDELGKEYNKFFDGMIKQGFSPVSEFFQGQLQDSLQCKNCGFKSSNFSTFYMLSLSIPQSSGAFGKKAKKVSLEDCIGMFTTDEVLTGDNAWDCPECSKRREKLNAVVSNDTDTLAEKSILSKSDKEKARKHRLHFTNGFKFRGRSSSPAPKEKERERDKDSIWKRSGSRAQSPSVDVLASGHSHLKKKAATVKSLTFVHLPPILIIHLSRFLFYDTSQKDTAIVQYPLILEVPHNGRKVNYKLFGVVNHSGTLKSGHYTSITNKSLDHDLIKPDWFYFDDETVKHTKHGSYSGSDVTHMSSSEVYVLFYDRIGPE